MITKTATFNGLTYIDFCLPCYLTDSYSRDGQMLVPIYDGNYEPKDVADEVLEYIDSMVNEFPSSIKSEEIMQWCIDNDFFIEEDGNWKDTDQDDEDECPYHYVLVEWS